MITSEHVLDLSLPENIDYSTPEGVAWRINHDLAIKIGGLTTSGRYYKAASATQVKVFAQELPDLHSRLLTSVVSDLELQGISAHQDISPPRPASRLPEGYVQLDPPLTAASQTG